MTQKFQRVFRKFGSLPVADSSCFPGIHGDCCVLFRTGDLVIFLCNFALGLILSCFSSLLLEKSEKTFFVLFVCFFVMLPGMPESSKCTGDEGTPTNCFN